jgi:anti-anti-sigma factor
MASTSIVETQRGSWIEISLKGRVDAFNDRRLMSQMEKYLQPPGRKIVLELSQCEFMSMAFLRGLVGLAQKLEAQGGRFVLLTPHHQVKRQIEIFVGNNLFEIYRSFHDLEFTEHQSETSAYF